MVADAGPSGRWWLALWAAPTAVLLATALALEYSPLDAALSAPFHDAQAGGFPLRHHWFFAKVLHTGAKWLVVIAAVAALIGSLAGWRWQVLRPWRWPGLYLAACVGATTAIVGILKATTNRYSPWSIDLFGGEVPLTPLFAGTPAPFSDGHSFPAGHAAGAFAWVSLWFVGRASRAHHPWLWLLPGVTGGLLFAWTQHVRGAHFASHNLWTLAIAWTVATVLAAAFARWELIPQAQSTTALSASTREPPMAIPTRSWLIGIAGLFAGCMLFAVDTAVEHLHLGPDELHFWIECAEFTLIGPGLGVLSLLLVERLRAARATAQAHSLAERERRFLVLGRMAAAVAHEVRNPLHTLRLVVDELRVEQPALRNHPLSAHIDDSLERIDRAVDLVYQLARPGTEDDGAGDLVTTLREALAALALHAGDRTFTMDALPDRAPVRCSSSGLRIMVDNLLRNATQAAALASPTGNVISVNLRSELGSWRLRITNPGILTTQPITQDDEVPSASRKADGLGLGLVITRHLAANAGGELTLSANNGTVTAELVLPVWKETVS